MITNEAFEIIKASKLIVIARGIYDEDLIDASLALYRGGVRAFEVTFIQDTYGAVMAENIERTKAAVSMLRSSLPQDACIGAGTVMDPDQVKAAYEAGASFIISPVVDPDVIKMTKRFGMLSIPGAMTPTEIYSAYSYGADIVKVFPAGLLGAEYFKAVRAPLPHIPLAAVAGITKENIKDFSRAGAVAFGISSTLYKKDAVAAKDFSAIENAAKEFYSALE